VAHPVDDFYEIGTLDLVDRLFPQEGENILLENTNHLGVRATPSDLDFQLAAFHPIREYDAKRILVRLADGQLLLSAMRLWIDALGQQGARFVARKARLPERDCQVGAERDTFLFAGPIIAEVPGFPAVGRDVEGKPVTVAKRVGRASGFGLPNGQV
jgi:hypothetical protein